MRQPKSSLLPSLTVVAKDSDYVIRLKGQLYSFMMYINHASKSSYHEIHKLVKVLMCLIDK